MDYLSNFVFAVELPPKMHKIKNKIPSPVETAAHIMAITKGKKMEKDKLGITKKGKKDKKFK